MRRDDLFQVDAFTQEVFGGNPAIVCFLGEEKEESWYQVMASEMNLPITCFVHEKGNETMVRWFTPTAEVDLCGHGTLAAAHVLWEQGIQEKASTIEFVTSDGTRLQANYKDQWIELNFPKRPFENAERVPLLEQALGTEVLELSITPGKYLAEVRSEDELRSLSPDFQKLASLPRSGVIVTAKGDGSKYDFVSRYFAPAIGIDEDSVTGSAHCALGPYWQQKLGKDSFLAFQASPRGGTLKVEVRGERVLLSGQAKTVFQGKLTL